MEIFKADFSFKDNREKFNYLFLSAIYGIVYFYFFVLLNPTPPEPKPDFTLFGLAWSACPALGLLSAGFLRRLNVETFSGDARFFPILLFTNVFLLLLYLQPNWGIHFFEGNGWAWLAFFFCAQLLDMGILWLIRKMTRDSTPNEGDPLHLYQATLIFFIVWLFTIHGFTHMLRGWGPLNYLFLAGTCGLFYFVVPFGRETTASQGKTRVPGKVQIPRWIPLCAVFLLIAYLVIDPYFPYQRYHASYYLGPLEEFLAGKSLLANINAQYGVLIFYFLGAIFRFLPLGYTSFSWADTMLIVGQYCVFYFVVRRLFRSGFYSFLCLLVLLIINHFAQTPRPSIVPSAGPLRFGFIYVLMLLVLWRSRNPARRNLALWLESLLMGVAAFWSYDGCFYTVPPYLAFILFETVQFEKGIGLDGKAFLKRVLMLGTSVLLVGGFLYADIYRRSGGLPHWSYYMDYIFLYEGGKSVMRRPDMDYWCIVAGALYFSAFALLAVTLNRKNGKPLPENMNVIALVTLYGIFQYLYFIYRSHPNNLFHISMPSILLFAYWLHYLRSQEPPFIPAAARKITFGLAVAFIGIYLQAWLPTAITKIKEQAVPLPEFWNRFLAGSQDLPRDDAFAVETEALMRKYSGNKKTLPYFLGYRGSNVEEYADLGLEVSMYDHRVKSYPYNDLSQTNICPPLLARLKAFDPRLQKGDYVYYRPTALEKPGDPFDEKIYFENDLMAGLSKRYDLKQVDQEDGIGVYQVQGIGKP